MCKRSAFILHRHSFPVHLVQAMPHVPQVGLANPLPSVGLGRLQHHAWEPPHTGSAMLVMTPLRSHVPHLAGGSQVQVVHVGGYPLGGLHGGLQGVWLQSPGVYILGRGAVGVGPMQALIGVGLGCGLGLLLLLLAWLLSLGRGLGGCRGRRGFAGGF